MQQTEPRKIRGELTVRKPGLLSKRYRYAWVAIFVITLAEICLNFARWFPDSGSYAEFASSGRVSLGGAYGPTVELRFLLPFLAGSLSRALPSLGVSNSFGLINSAFWAGSVGLAYGIGDMLSDRRAAVFSAIFFTTSVAVLAYGAAVLSDAPGYFFCGLALFLVLRSSRRSPPRSIAEGAGLAVGVFFHPSALSGLVFGLSYRIRERWGAVWTFLGALLPAALGAYVAISKGWLQALLLNSTFIFSVSRLMGPRAGPSIFDALVWTFNVSCLFVGQTNFMSLAIVANLQFLWFAAICAVGFWKSKRKILLSSYLLLLTFLPIIATTFIERYLFVMWPFFIPILVSGVREVARIPSSIASTLLSRFGASRLGVFSNPDLYAAVFILIQGLANTIAIMTALGPSVIRL